MKNVSILIIEAMTMWDGINAAIDLGFKDIIVEGDNKLVIQSIRGEVKNHGKFR